MIQTELLVKQKETMSWCYQHWVMQSQNNARDILSISITFLNIHGLKQRTLCQTVRFIFHFSWKLYSQFGKHFHNMVLYSLDRNYFKKMCYFFVQAT